jgi:phospholipid transport system substrate-binding protein
MRPRTNMFVRSVSQVYPSNFWRMLIISVVAAAFVLATEPSYSAGGKTSPEGATKFMKALGQEAINLLSDESLTRSEREGHVRNLLAENFDIAVIGRYVLGPALRKTSEEQRERYQSQFRAWMLGTYSQRLAGYSGGTMSVTDVKPYGKKDVLVSTQFDRPSGKPLVARWRVRQKKDGYRILDLVIKGVSMAMTQREEFRSVVRQKGVDGLISMLESQTAALEKTAKKVAYIRR